METKLSESNSMVTELENKLKESSAKIDNAIANLKKENEYLRENVQQKEN